MKVFFVPREGKRGRNESQSRPEVHEHKIIRGRVSRILHLLSAK